MAHNSSFNSITENIPQFILGILIYVAFNFFGEGMNWYSESQNIGGKGLGAIAEGLTGVFYMSVSLLFLVPIFIYLFKYLTKNRDESKLFLIILTSGFLFGLVFKFLSERFDNYMQARSHISKFQLAQNYVNETFKDYEPIYNMINDSLKVWKKDSLWFVYEESRSLSNSQIDSLIVFNKQKNRFKACSHFSFKHDDDWRYNTGFKYIYGIKHNDKWFIAPYPQKQEYFAFGLFNLESSEYSLSRLSIMYRIYKIKGEIYPDQIEIPMVNDQGYYGISKFDSLQVEDQLNILDSILNVYKTLKEDYQYYDNTERYGRDWRMLREFEKANKINNLIFRKIRAQ